MGFGFKSVFEISEKPEVYSGNFSFHFDEHLIVPYWIDPVLPSIQRQLKSMKDKGSVFVLPSISAETYQQVDTALSLISPSILLYLQNLQEIRIGRDVLRKQSGPHLSSMWVKKRRERRQLW